MKNASFAVKTISFLIFIFFLLNLKRKSSEVKDMVLFCPSLGQGSIFSSAARGTFLNVNGNAFKIGVPSISLLGVTILNLQPGPPF